MSDILDLIDGAIGDVGADAMRWRPEVMPAELPPEQVEAVRVAFVRIAAQLTEVALRMEPAFAELARKLRPLLPLFAEVQAHDLRVRMWRRKCQPRVRV